MLRGRHAHRVLSGEGALESVFEKWCRNDAETVPAFESTKRGDKVHDKVSLADIAKVRTDSGDTGGCFFTLNHFESL